MGFPARDGDLPYGGFEESYIYWANGKGENGYPVSQSLGLRAKEYGDINGKEVRLEHWTGTAGIADKDAGVNKPNDPNFAPASVISQFINFNMRRGLPS